MIHENQADWPYPGSRWWKFDFHTHTPASLDTDWASGLTPEDWLIAFMRAGIDCVAVTDHNSGAWIDPLKAANAEMRVRADAGTPPEGYRELTLFPGVEISVNGGFHLLAILPPNATTGDIDALLGQVRYRGTKGDCDAVTEASAVQVVRTVLESGAIPIPAHADGPKGLLRILPDSHKSALDPNTVRQVMDLEEILAVEWIDRSRPPPEIVSKAAERTAWVLGSDCHGVDAHKPGSRFTWIKMATPTLEGLRLALLDGDGISVRRSDAGDFHPLRAPKHFIAGVEIEAARFIGNAAPERLSFSPYCNALIGGRGTGKSTIVHALRLGYGRDEELRRLGSQTEPYRQFASFAEVAKSRTADGGVRESTEVRVELSRDGVLTRLRWRQSARVVVVEEQDGDGQWCPSESQAVTPERFPVRLFSQGQIAAMAGAGRRSLLDVIDEAAGVGELKRNLASAERAYLSQRARLREMEGELARRAELQRQHAELTSKLDAFEASRHTDVLKAHRRAARQRHEVDVSLEQLMRMPEEIKSATRLVILDDWPEGVFDSATDHDVIAWRNSVDRALERARQTLVGVATDLDTEFRALRADARLGSWHERIDETKTDYATLQDSFVQQGIVGPRDFDRLLQERQQSEGELARLEGLARDRDDLVAESDAELTKLWGIRKSITQARRTFLEKTLVGNPFVQMEVVAFGFDARQIERSLRERLDCEDDRFEADILEIEGGAPTGGLAFDLANASDEKRESELVAVQKSLKENDDCFGGRFRNYLERSMRNRPEFGDRILCWFPEDDLRIKYSRAGDSGDWASIRHASQGQRSAALLAFLLAFGDEPLVLDQPEDDLDNHLIYDLIVRQIRENKVRRQLIVVTHNPNVVVNGDAELVHVMSFSEGQCRVVQSGALQEGRVREDVCDVMEGGREAFARRWARLGREV